MGIETIPNTALGPAVVAGPGAPMMRPIDLVPWLAGCAWMVGWFRRRRSLVDWRRAPGREREAR